MTTDTRPRRCETCGAEADLATLAISGRVRIRHHATTPVPSMKQIEAWDSDGGCEATDGCWVEPDGKCEHGHLSWMRSLGLI